MNKTTLIIIGIIIVAAGIVAFVLWNGFPAGQKAGDLVARVNGEDISREDFDVQFAQAEQLFLQQGADPSNPQLVEQLQAQVLDQMIAGILIRQEAEKAGLAVDESQVETEISAIIQNVGGREAFDQEIANANLSEEELRGNIRERFLVNQYINSQIPEGEIIATDEEMRALYDEVSAQQELPPFEEVEEEIRAEIIRQKIDERIGALIASLHASAEVEILP